ncbi:hypothetical protein pb186bvf_015270 [Paramecium bursaria]
MLRITNTQIQSLKNKIGNLIFCNQIIINSYILVKFTLKYWNNIKPFLENMKKRASKKRTMQDLQEFYILPKNSTSEMR